MEKQIKSWRNIVDTVTVLDNIIAVRKDGTVLIAKKTPGKIDVFDNIYGDQLDTLLNTKVGAYTGE